MAKYFPFLRAKQFDLKAVEKAAPALVTNGQVMPILEPVRVATASLVGRAAKFASAGLQVGLVMNPQVGEMSGNPQATAQLLVAMRNAGASVVPVLVVHTQLQAQEVTAFGGHVLQGTAIYLHYDVPAAAALVASLRRNVQALNLFVDNATSANHLTTGCRPHRGGRFLVFRGGLGVMSTTLAST